MEQKPTILIAEDDSSNFMYFDALLHSKYRILWAKNGQEAVDMALENDVDVVLMDYKMPVLTGMEATRIIKEKKPGLKVVVQTAFAMFEFRQQAMSVGADEFLTKPVSCDTLIETIEKMISER
ncbi:MAG: response regulator [Prevotellaceae bacterium]|nr:response regulator [Candidatus Minthosoma caballi]